MPTFGYHGYVYTQQLIANVSKLAPVLHREEQARELIEQYEARTAELRQRGGRRAVDASRHRPAPDAGGKLLDQRRYVREHRVPALGMARPEGQDNAEDFGVNINLEQNAHL